MTDHKATFEPGALRLTRDLVRLAIDPSIDHTPVRRGVWLPTAIHRQLDRVQLHRAFVHATALVTDVGQPHTFCGTSAAAVWQLPRIGPWPGRCEVLVSSPRRSSDLIRTHRGAPVDPVLVHGVRVTPVDRTVVDLARSDSLEAAVVAGDHAVREGLCTLSDLRILVDDIPRRGRGRSRAALVVSLIDPLSMSVGESLSKVRMFQLNLPRPRLQVEHRDDRGLIGIADFDWGGVVGEFDGKLKYAVPAGAAAQEAGEVVWREKQREDRLRRVGNRMARWVWADAMAPARLGAILAKEGIRPQPRCTWFDLGASRSA